MGKIRNLAGSILIGVAALFFPVRALPEPIEIFSHTYSVQMAYDYDKKTQETLEVGAVLDEEEDKLYFAYFTENYNRKDWSGTEKENFPITRKHTEIDSADTKIFILHPKEVKISKVKQIAYIVPDYKSKELKSKDGKETRVIYQTSEMNKGLIDVAVSEIGIPFEIFMEFADYSWKKETESYAERLKKINRDYALTEIVPQYLTPSMPRIETIETAKGYDISFDMSDISGNIPMFLLTKIQLGNPATFGDLSKNKHGKLENLLINFTLDGKRKYGEIDYIKDLFPKEKEKSLVIPIPPRYFANFGIDPELLKFGDKESPASLNEKGLEELQEGEQFKDLLGVWFGIYLIKGSEKYFSSPFSNKGELTELGIEELKREYLEDSASILEMSVFKFRDKKTLENLTSSLGGSRETIFLKDEFIALLSHDPITNEEQGISYIIFLMDYNTRIKPDLVLHSEGLSDAWEFGENMKTKKILMEKFLSYKGRNLSRLREEETKDIMDTIKKIFGKQLPDEFSTPKKALERLYDILNE